ncbi:MAG TPA: ABC transporter permease [Gemmatimonadaceae bacterium]
MSWLRRLVNTVRARAISRELEREVSFHLAEREDELVQRGMPRVEASREARRLFGNRTLHVERTRERDVLGWLDSVLADVRYGVRSLIANPGFTVVAILSLALGIGANVAIFSLTDALVLRSLPVRDPEQLLVVTSRDKGPANPTFQGIPIVTNPMWEEIRDHTHVFSSVFAYEQRRFDLSNGGLVRHTSGALASGAFFKTLGVQPVAGRLFVDGDDVRGYGGIAVVSGGFAAREFGTASSAVGRTLSINGHPMEIIGVSDPRFFGVDVGTKADVFVPLCTLDLIDGKGTLDSRMRWFAKVIGRPAPGLTLAAVRARLAAASPMIQDAVAPTDGSSRGRSRFRDRVISVRPASEVASGLRAQYEQPLALLMAAVAVVLLIACMNIANLLVARAARRAHELAIRLSLGASRARLVRQLLTESALLAVAGAVLGACVARWADRLIVAWISTRQDPASLDLTFDWRVVAFAAILALGTVLVFGVAPALRATRVDPHAAMKAGGRGVAAGRRQRMSRPLVAAQLALSLALIAGAGLLVETFRNLNAVDPGFRPDGVVLVQADFSRAVTDSGRTIAVEREALQAMRSIPGVRSASGSMLTSMGHLSWNNIIFAPGSSERDGADSAANFNEVTEDFFGTTGTRLLAGRAFTATDGDRSDIVAIVNRAFARRFFGVDNPVGLSFRTPAGDSTTPPYQIVGVVGDTKYASLDEVPDPIVYLPLGSKAGLVGYTSLTYEVRTDLGADAIVRATRDAMARVNPAIEFDVTTFSSQISATLARPRLLAILSSFFGVLALALAVIGLYGTLAYDVARRRNEIGIRMALGAAWRDVVRLVVRDAGRVVLAGIVVGEGLALASARLLASFLYRIAPQDVATLCSATLVLAITALIATMVPAWRAVRVEPSEALRDE